MQYSTEFGYSRKDVLLIGGGLLALGVALYNGLQALGMEPGMAGNFVQAGIFLSLCVGWVASYLLRVINKAGPAPTSYSQRCCLVPSTLYAAFLLQLILCLHSVR